MGYSLLIFRQGGQGVRGCSTLLASLINICFIHRIPIKLLFMWGVCLCVGPQSCSAAVTCSPIRVPWATSSCGPTGQSRCHSWPSQCWTSGSVCLTCGRLWPVHCRSNRATASSEGAPYASRSAAINFFKENLFNYKHTDFFKSKRLWWKPVAAHIMFCFSCFWSIFY